MDLPLSKGNETAEEVFKKTNKNYQNWVIKNNEFMNKNIKSNKNITSILDNIKKASEPLRKFRDQVDQATAPLKKMQKDYQEIGRKLRFNSGGIMSIARAKQITGGFELWGQSENFTPPLQVQPLRLYRQISLGSIHGYRHDKRAWSD